MVHASGTPAINAERNKISIIIRLGEGFPLTLQIEAKYLDEPICALEVGRRIKPEACLSHTVALALKPSLMEVDMQGVGQCAMLLQGQQSLSASTFLALIVYNWSLPRPPINLTVIIRLERMCVKCI